MTQHLTLQPYQLEAHKAGRLKAIVVPMEKEPDGVSRYGEPWVKRAITKMDPATKDLYETDKTDDGKQIAQRIPPPFTPGEPVAVREEWGWSINASMPVSPHYPQMLIYKAGFTGKVISIHQWMPPDTMPDWAVRTHLTLGQPTPVEIEKITEEQANLCGLTWDDSGQITGRERLMDDWHTRHPDAKWGWYYPVEGTTP